MNSGLWRPVGFKSPFTSTERNAVRTLAIILRTWECSWTRRRGWSLIWGWMRKGGRGWICWKTRCHDVQLNKPPVNEPQSHILICVSPSPCGLGVACHSNADFCGIVCSWKDNSSNLRTTLWQLSTVAMDEKSERVDLLETSGYWRP